MSEISLRDLILAIYENDFHTVVNELQGIIELDRTRGPVGFEFNDGCISVYCEAPENDSVAGPILHQREQTQ